MGINICTYIGNLTADPELLSVGDSHLLRFAIAVTTREPRHGKIEEITCFRNCSIFGARAAGLARVLAKGAKVMIKGHNHYDTWTDKASGATRHGLSVRVEDLDIMASARPKAVTDGIPFDVMPAPLPASA